jgi:hypothetical protein
VPDGPFFALAVAYLAVFAIVFGWRIVVSWFQ